MLLVSENIAITVFESSQYVLIRKFEFKTMKKKFQRISLKKQKCVKFIALSIKREQMSLKK